MTLDLQEAKKLLINITQIAAPSFQEQNRAKFVSDYLAKLGFKPKIDAVGNVICQLTDFKGPKVLIASHLDTVFPIETNLSITEDKNILIAPGIGDNTASLTIALLYAKEIAVGNIKPKLKLFFTANCGEEGLGDLFGIKEVLKNDSFDYFIAIDGYLDMIIDRAVGSKRYKLDFRARGGHSWGDYPSPSAVHALAEASYKLSKIRMSVKPKTSINIGQISGGTSINTIAEQAEANLDMRSTDPKALQRIEKTALALIKQVAKENDVSVEIEKIGDRPCGNSDNAKLLEITKKIITSYRLEPVVIAGSTDANAAFALGIPAITIGVYKGGDAHRKSEWVDLESFKTGIKVLRDFLDELAVL